MSRYTGPRLRKCRRVQTDLPGLTRHSITDRPGYPGQHGLARRRRPSEYADQLTEKQKLRFNYGLNEGQLTRLVERARKSKAVTGDKVVELLERRLDSVVFRAGFARTIPAGRQFVTHGHILVNDRRLDIPSYAVKVGDKISVRGRDGAKRLVSEALAEPALPVPAWLIVDAEHQTIEVASLPGPDALPFECDLQLVVEFYAR